jgi:hypothetical protein
VLAVRDWTAGPTAFVSASIALHVLVRAWTASVALARALPARPLEA